MAKVSLTIGFDRKEDEIEDVCLALEDFIRLSGYTQEFVILHLVHREFDLGDTGDFDTELRNKLSDAISGVFSKEH